MKKRQLRFVFLVSIWLMNFQFLSAMNLESQSNDDQLQVCVDLLTHLKTKLVALLRTVLDVQGSEMKVQDFGKGDSLKTEFLKKYGAIIGGHLDQKYKDQIQELKKSIDEKDRQIIALTLNFKNEKELNDKLLSPNNKKLLQNLEDFSEKNSKQSMKIEEQKKIIEELKKEIVQDRDKLLICSDLVKKFHEKFGGDQELPDFIENFSAQNRELKSQEAQFKRVEKEEQNSRLIPGQLKVNELLSTQNERLIQQNKQLSEEISQYKLAYDKQSVDFEKKKQEFDIKINNVNEEKVSLNNDIETTRKEIKTLNEKNSELDKNYQETVGFLKKAQEIYQENEKYQQQLETKNLIVKELEKEQVVLKNKIEELNKELQNWQSLFSEKKVLSQKNIELQKEINQKDQQIKNQDERIKFYKEKLQSSENLVKNATELVWKVKDQEETIKQYEDQKELLKNAVVRLFQIFNITNEMIKEKTGAESLDTLIDNAFTFKKLYHSQYESTENEEDDDNE